MGAKRKRQSAHIRKKKMMDQVHPTNDPEYHPKSHQADGHRPAQWLGSGSQENRTSTAPSGAKSHAVGNLFFFFLFSFLLICLSLVSAISLLLSLPFVLWRRCPASRSQRRRPYSVPVPGYAAPPHKSIICPLLYPISHFLTCNDAILAAFLPAFVCCMTVTFAPPKSDKRDKRQKMVACLISHRRPQ